jgi:DNA-binding transcriptional LysR family regulator
MRINFELLDVRAFLAVIELGGFHKAAEALAISQPALSRRIQSLEAAVGAPLLERTTRHVAPTAIGRSFAPMARRLIDEFEDSLLGVTGLGDRQAGLITLACVPTAVFYFLPQAIEQFARTYPRIRIRILDVSANDGLEAVRSGEAEFGINFTGSADAGLTFTSLLDDPFVLACRRDHHLAAKEDVTWADLEEETLIGVSRQSGNRQTLEDALGRTSVRLAFRYEVNHLTTSLGLVERGLGVSVLPRLATPPAEHSVIVTRLLTGPIVQRTIGIVERRASRLSPLAQRFRDMLIARWSAAPGEAS